MDQPEAMRFKSVALVRELMKSKEMTVRDVADRLVGVMGKSSFGDLLTGKKATCRPAQADRIAEILGLDTCVLFAPAVSAKRGRPSTRQDSAA